MHNRFIWYLKKNINTIHNFCPGLVFVLYSSCTLKCEFVRKYLNNNLFVVKTINSYIHISQFFNTKLTISNNKVIN